MFPASTKQIKPERLAQYKQIPRSVILANKDQTKVKQATIKQLSSVLISNKELAIQIIATLTAFKRYRKSGTSAQQEGELNTLYSLVANNPAIGTKLTGENLVKLVKNQSSLFQKNLPETFANFLLALKHSNNEVFNKVAVQHSQFLLDAGVLTPNEMQALLADKPNNEASKISKKSQGKYLSEISDLEISQLQNNQRSEVKSARFYLGEESQLSQISSDGSYLSLAPSPLSSHINNNFPDFSQDSLQRAYPDINSIKELTGKITKLPIKVNVRALLAEKFDFNQEIIPNYGEELYAMGPLYLKSLENKEIKQEHAAWIKKECGKSYLDGDSDDDDEDGSIENATIRFFLKQIAENKGISNDIAPETKEKLLKIDQSNIILPQNMAMYKLNQFLERNQLQKIIFGGGKDCYAGYGNTPQYTTSININANLNPTFIADISSDLANQVVHAELLNNKFHVAILEYLPKFIVNDENVINNTQNLLAENGVIISMGAKLTSENLSLLWQIDDISCYSLNQLARTQIQV